MSQQLPRGGSRGGRGRETGADGWSSVPQQVQRTAGSAGDMSQFGRIRSQQGGSRFGGPSSAFNRNRSQQKEEAPAQTARSNPFAALENDDAAVESGEGEGRRPLKVLPRTKPVEGQGEPKEQGMSDEAIQRSINNSIKEYLTIKDVKEGQESFNALPSDARWRLIKQLAGTVIKDKQPAVEAAVELFKAVQSNATVTKDDFVRAYNEDIEELLEISYDAPYAVRFYGQLLKASSLSKEDVEAISKNIKGEEPEEAEDVREQLMVRSFFSILQKLFAYVFNTVCFQRLEVWMHSTSFISLDGFAPAL